MTLAMRLSDRPLWGAPKNYEIDLRDLMDMYYGRGVWTKRTGTNAGSDITPAIHLGCDLIRTTYGHGYGAIRIPPGLWMKKTDFDPTKLSGISLLGLISASSGLVCSSAHGINRNGAGGFGAYRTEHLGIFKEIGFTGGVGWLDQGDSVSQTGQITGRDIYMSVLDSSARWATNLLLDGKDKPIEPAGIRVADLHNLQLFNAGDGGGYSVGLFNVRQATIDNMGTYGGSGALANNIYVGDGGVATANTQQLRLGTLICGGRIELTDCSVVSLQGAASVFAADSTADYIEGWLKVGSVVGAPGASSNIITRT